MRTEYEIAKRLYFSAGKQGKKMSRPAVRVAVGGIILGIAVMMITLSIVIGFKQTVREKAIGFGGHIEVVNFDNNSTYEMQPIRYNDTLLTKLRSIPNVISAEPFATKPGIIKTGEAFQGVVLKGTESTAPDSANSDKNSLTTNAFFLQNLVAGRMPQNEREVLISKNLASLLNFKLDSCFFCYFIQADVRVRKYTICGLYDTQFADYDNLFILGNINEIRRLNDWEENQASGIEIRISDFRHLEEVNDAVYFATANRIDADGNSYFTQNIVEQNPVIFSWLNLLDTNVVVIIILMLCVSGMSIISGLIILILDSVQLIGTMKALGATDKFLRRIFLVEAAMLICKGILWGNLLGLCLCALQHFLHIIPLDPATYYVDYVPVAWPWLAWTLLNVGTLLTTLLILLLPSAIVSKISPAKVMRFE